MTVLGNIIELQEKISNDDDIIKEKLKGFYRNNISLSNINLEKIILLINIERWNNISKNDMLVIYDYLVSLLLKDYKDVVLLYQELFIKFGINDKSQGWKSNLEYIIMRMLNVIIMVKISDGSIDEYLG
jgi:hypothetical protein